MKDLPVGAIAVIFVSMRTETDPGGYADAATLMVEKAEKFPGFLGVDSARGTDGVGITVSYWASQDDALAWKRDAEHSAVRDLGRDRWYRWYRLHVTQLLRSYGWSAGGAGGR
jgi:heme-degrading monooxygenase HmoA